MFLAEDMPTDKAKWDKVLLTAMGAPHPRQIDVVGGGESTTSKVAILSKSSRSEVDIDYLFAQVNPNSSIVDYSSNCGNMLSAVGHFAIENDLVTAVNPTTTIHIHNVNTNALLIAVVQTPGGKITFEGSTAIDGMPGTAAPVRLDFARTIGSKTGNLLPTGKVREIVCGVKVTLLDVAVPAMVVLAKSLGKTGHESKAELDADAALIARPANMRLEAGYRMGLGDCKQLVVPKPILVAAHSNGDYGVVAARDFVPFNCHAVFSVTGAMALATACLLPGNELPM